MKDEHEFSLEHAQQIKNHLTRRSTQICHDNKCTDDEHKCESYAYIRHDGVVLDICYPDYFQGCSSAHAAIPLPFVGSSHQLRDEIEEQCSDFSGE